MVSGSSDLFSFCSFNKRILCKEKLFLSFYPQRSSLLAPSPSDLDVPPFLTSLPFCRYLAFLFIPISPFLSKPLPVPLLLHSASMTPLTTSMAVHVSCSWSHAWRGVPPQFSSAASSSRMLPSNAIKKPLKKTTSLSLLKGGLQICPSSVEFTNVRNMNTRAKRKCE